MLLRADLNPIEQKDLYIKLLLIFTTQISQIHMYSGPYNSMPKKNKYREKYSMEGEEKEFLQRIFTLLL